MNEEKDKRTGSYDDRPLGIDEAAALCGYKKSYLYRLSSRGEIPVYRPRGGKIFFKQSELLEFVFRGRKSSVREVHEKAEAVLLNRPNERHSQTMQRAGTGGEA
jgi:excisionase family DNA binding protein